MQPDVPCVCRRSVPGLASLAFGRGAFDPKSLYATQIRGGRLRRFRRRAAGSGDASR